MGLRELARKIGKSPAYVVSLERSESSPSVSEETLRSLASELGLELDLLLASVKKTPQELAPRSPTQVALYRLIRYLPSRRQEELREQLEREIDLPKAVRTKEKK